MKIKKYINGKSFISELKSSFSMIPDHRKTPEISLEDSLMSGFAMFQLKFPSLLKFEESRKKKNSNLNNIYQITNIPSDTRMREIIDPIETSYLSRPFKEIFNTLQKGKILDKFKYIEEYVLISSDGTGTFSSNKVHCNHCLEKYSKSSKKTSYQHQCLTAAMVHPERKIALPFFPEMIKKEDGFSKNDCELNASKRLWNKFREDHPQLKAIALEDALYSNAPHINHLKKLNLRFIITVKEKGNNYVFNAAKKRESSLEDVRVLVKNKVIGEKIKKEVESIYRFVNEVPLNSTDKAPLVNFLEFIETIRWVNNKGEKKEEQIKYAWVTDLTINDFNVEKIVKAGRCRWKIENEAFNTLKNQGYNFEYNYGHGHKNLCSNFTCLMLLAFLFDQALEAFCNFYKKLRDITRTRYGLWEAMRATYRYFKVNDWNHFLETILENEIDTC